MNKKISRIFIYLFLSLLLVDCDLVNELLGEEEKVEAEAEEKIQIYTITFDKNDPDATGTMESITIDEAREVKLPMSNFSKPGYIFKDWIDSNSLIYENESVISISENKTLLARWDQITHEVSFIKNLSSATGNMEDRTVGEGTTFLLPSNQFRSNTYIFLGWSFTADGSIELENLKEIIISDTDLTLYAQWQEVEFSQGDLGYTLSYTYIDGDRVYDGGYSVSTLNTNLSGELTVPEEVNGYKVTTVASNAFKDCRYLESIILPDSITSIGSYAFNNCVNLENIVLREGITSIGSYAFSNNNYTLTYSLKNIELPNSLVSIGSSAFAGSNLEQIVIPDNITEISDNMFQSCYELTEITLPSNLTMIGDDAFANTAITTMIIPESVTEIGTYAFSGCQSLTYVKLPDNLETISSGLFHYCILLSSLEMPENVTTIEDNVFGYCQSLTSFLIPSSVTNLGASAFRRNYGLESIVIPSSVRHIYEYTFHGCDNLTSVTLSEGVETIDSNAFLDCANLTYISFPDSLTTVTGTAFHESSKLNYSIVPDNFFETFTNLTTNDFARTVTFDSQSATTEPSESSINIPGPHNALSDFFTSLFPSRPKKDSYTFGGWFTQTNGNGSEFIESTVVSENITVYANWVGKSYEIEFNDQSATTDPSFSSTIVIYPQTSLDSLPAPPEKTGYTFVGWYTSTNGSGTEFTADTIVTRDDIIYAYWVENYNITFDDHGATTDPSFSSTTVIYPQASIGSLPTAPEKTGYTFVGWFTGYYGEGTEFNAETTVTNDYRVYAYWIKYYTITFNDQGATTDPSFSSATVIYPQISMDSLPTAPEKTDYTFKGWYTSTNGTGSKFSSISTVTADDTVYAYWNSYGNAEPIVDQIGQTTNTTTTLPTRVWARISDEDGLNDIKSVMASQTCTSYSYAHSFTLYDDGTHGDANAGDGIFEYIFVDGDMRFYSNNTGHLWTITATDSKNATGVDSW